jgi:hypothetical protein
MHDWAREVRSRLSTLQLSPAREAEIVDELSQHLEDRWRELIAGGTAPDDATRLCLALSDSTASSHIRLATARGRLEFEWRLARAPDRRIDSSSER